ncbi:IclR family transcriptional regulator domain-containing protein [Coraliomargarita akajimensis]|uniref:Transcriptional regulator, IclR family n=1 Tax=Coraliomargarita akajimensis (strain DSM 45221 / IAM 15411 / JCM 23193 / KCTC 12865 / 04OKA010-24) TaxID=583355 RepID=D5EQZ3_CORAD|nr:IclR family transcriptional regulator C-terminal domain-containing protein [Coraliomargarita akajimensis]ADE53986.1 transcriptional regulator, IclR family [Coraliomargarita akajimensis DSM 45221]
MNDREIVALSHDILRNLESQLGYTIALGRIIPGKGAGLVLAAIDGSKGVSYHLEAGYEFDLHIGAPGKAILARMDREARMAIYPDVSFTRYTETTICSVDDYERELECVRECGYGIDHSEYIAGCHCVSVPVMDGQDQPIAAFWATAPKGELPMTKFDDVAVALRNGANELTRRLTNDQGRASSREHIVGIVEELRNYLCGNLNGGADVSEFAESHYVSYSWLRHAFKDYTGEAPTQYHTNRRIEKAEQFLTQTDFPIRQISEELGFSDQNHFSSLFKRKTGLSPSKYRNAKR